LYSNLHYDITLKTSQLKILLWVYYQSI
jgi:hypothetical protein